jgi:hypothetical protein
MATGELNSEVAGHVETSKRIEKIGDDAHGERIAAGAGEMLLKQVSSSLCLAEGGSADDFDVVSLPVHLPRAGSLHHISSEGLEVGESESEFGVGIDCLAQCHRRFGAIGGSLRPAVPRGRLWVSADSPTMIFDRQRGKAPVVSRATTRRLHDHSVHGSTEVPLRRC